MKNLTDLKCRNCNKIACSHGLDFAIIIVHFEENKNAILLISYIQKMVYMIILINILAIIHAKAILY